MRFWRTLALLFIVQASQRVHADAVKDTIRVYDGRAALRTSRAIAQIPAPGGAPAVMTLRSLHVYVKIDTQWRWVSEQSTPVPAPGQDTAVPPDARAAIAAANNDWVPALKRHDADAI